VQSPIPWGPPHGAGAPYRVRIDLSIGDLVAQPALERPDLLAPPVLAALQALGADGVGVAGVGVAGVGVADVGVAEIDPDVADTAAFCARYRVGLDVSANCVVVAGKREGDLRLAACVVLATTRAAVNTVVRRHLDVRKVSFLAVEEATARTGMEFGGITPVGLPADWPVLVDGAVAAAGRVVVGSGLRRSKLTLPASLLASLPAATVLPDLAGPVEARREGAG
jgi:prolyl-tRNA editing enzyme YbaK/EbsC (Cys-tRNA(Pro) deacylase)